MDVGCSYTSFEVWNQYFELKAGYYFAMSFNTNTLSTKMYRAMKTQNCYLHRTPGFQGPQ